MIDLKLIGNKAFQWVEKENHYFIGYFFDEKNVIYTGNNAINYLLHIENEYSAIPKLNGIYAYIKNNEAGIAISTDIINYFPLFYLKQNNNWIVSDDWNCLVGLKGGVSSNFEAKTEFHSIGFVLDNETLDKDIFKTRAGEQLLLHNAGTFTRVPDYSFLPDGFTNDVYQKLTDEITSELYEAGKRFITFLDSRTAVVPLSGGFDSRLIACILKKLNYENVICFTYGIPNKEEEISMKVARTLGYKWYFVDYREIELDTYLDDAQFIEYVKFAGNGYAMPYLQEYFAVKKLTAEKLIPENSVLLPGHSGDFLGGSYVVKEVKKKTENKNLSNYLVNKYFWFTKTSHKDKKHLIERVSRILQGYPQKNNYSKDYNPFVEDWDIKEKLSKFIFHSSKVFDFWGFETYFLLWDKKLIDLFRKIPYSYREHKFLYDDVAINEFFKPLHVYYSEGEMRTTSFDIKIQKIKNKVRNWFPWKYVLKRMTRHDWMYYAALTSVMEDRMEENGFQRLKKFKSFNAVICRWYWALQRK
jgi:asparagine synthase (glutamine-hydrolysing)